MYCIVLNTIEIQYFFTVTCEIYFFAIFYLLFFVLLLNVEIRNTNESSQND